MKQRNQYACLNMYVGIKYTYIGTIFEMYLFNECTHFLY